ncbi:MAG: methylenetetrahydrofolate reductase [Hyphomicrobiales bacterium]|nr:MAG: methylenetetrahydrofolate reductase [Hyphomicrobiales bacterium]
MMATDLNSQILTNFLNGYTAEVTSGDKKSMAAAEKMMDKGAEVFVASLPKDTIDKQVAAVVKIHQAGLKPVPHIVARNIKNLAALETTLNRFVIEAEIDTALILGGDRDDAVGDFDASLQLIETGLLQKVGIKKIYLGCYPEGHPRISTEILDKSRAAKLIAAEKAGLEVELVSQFCFESQPIIEFARKLRAEGVKVPFRVGVAGPSSRATLVKYAIICGVGASLRALKERQDLAKNMTSGETPEKLITELAEALEQQPELGLNGVHFFTFGSLEKSATFVNQVVN